jgi:putative transposase
VRTASDRAIDAAAGSQSPSARRRLPPALGERQDAAVAANVLDRSFEAPAPNRKWIADFTYVWTAEGWLYVAAVVEFQKLMSDHGVVCSMSRSGNVWDNAAMESFFSSLKTERIARKTYRTRDKAKADVFDHIECFYNPKRRHSTIGYLSPVEFEMQAGLA